MDFRLQMLYDEARLMSILKSALGGGDIAQKLKDMSFDVAKLSARRLPYERLDQMLTELLLGVL